MQKRKLIIEEVEELVLENRYPVDEETWFLSRCIDGRYQSTSEVEEERSDGKTSEVKLEPLAKPGADIGDLMMVFAANKEYGLEIESKNIFKAVLETVGGFENFRFHTDYHNQQSFLGCRHFKQGLNDPQAYGLAEDDIATISQFLSKIKKKGATGKVLEGEHLESAVLIIKGDSWSISPQLVFNRELIEIFVYHKTLDNRRRRILSQHLLPHVKAVFPVDEEYLYQILSQVTDDQLLETVTRLAKDLPIYDVKFEKNGEFEIKNL
jgi:hypothetical protein